MQECVPNVHHTCANHVLFFGINLSRVWTFMKTLVVDGKIRITTAAVLFPTDKRSEDNLREISHASLLKTKLRGRPGRSIDRSQTVQGPP